MSNETPASQDTTRRDYLQYGSAVLAGGLLAGCTSDPEPTTTPTDGGGGEGTPTETATPTPADYSVTMAPMGEVTFETVPERWMAYFSTYGDMAIVLGQLDGLSGLIFTDNWPLAFYDHLPDVEVSFEDVPQLFGESGIDREAFYELNSDLHLFDPNFIQLLDDNWSDEDFETIAEDVGPILGNSIRRRSGDWHDYQYYGLYEAFGKVATAFQERERYRALKSVHDDLISTVQSELPPEEERPTVGLVSVNSNFEKGSFYVYPVNEGNGHKQYRDLGMRGAFDDHIEGGYAKWDYEQLLEVDPDAFVFQYGFSHVSTEGFEERMTAMREDPVGQELSAVQHDRLYRGGTSYQGPVINLFQTEIAAKQFYPETFGRWDGLHTLADEDERLFDYGRVAEVINGDL